MSLRLLILLLLLPTFSKGSCPVNPCSFTPTCPTGYIYNSCYGSCYRVENTPTSYLTALQNCAIDGAHFFTPNTDNELAFATTLPYIQTSNTYWFGLQDWARRGVGSKTVSNGWNIPNSCSEDPDGVWYYMDESGTSLQPTHVTDTGSYVDQKTKWLPFHSPPVTGTDFVTYLTYYNGSWQVASSSDFSAVPRSYICEYSLACYTCPSGFVKFLSKCYKYLSKYVDYYSARNDCLNQSATLWAPRSEYLISYARMMANHYNTLVWIGLDRNSSWLWADDSKITGSCDFDVPNGLPSANDVTFRIVPDTSPGFLQGIRDGFGNANATSPGWSSTSSTTAAIGTYVCQQDATAGYYSSTIQTTLTESSTVETTLVESTVTTTTEDTITCGNGLLEVAFNEQCDDGNRLNGDGCDSQCLFETVERELDIYFAIDSSFGTPLLQFVKMKSFLTTLTKQFKLDNGSVQLNLIVFGGRTAGYQLLPLNKSQSYFNSSSSKEAVNSLFRSMIYFGNQPNLTNGLSRIVSYRHNASALAVSIIFITSSSLEAWKNHPVIISDNKVLLVQIGSTKTAVKLVGQLERSTVIQISHWDKLGQNLHLILRYLLTINAIN